VNAPVDEGIAEIVEILSEIKGLQTISSCQGEPGLDGKEAVVFFCFQNWREIGELLFERLPPMMEALDECRATLSISVLGNCPLQGRISFIPEVTDKMACLLRKAIRDSHSCEYSGGTIYKVPHSC